ncbi:MAG: SGNH/GDSL hydrolase family protein [Planctomycetes bacterium]|nr:SGNH/GDSL hydrolase family protein [Planctomycetota bacterium]
MAESPSASEPAAVPRSSAHRRTRAAVAMVACLGGLAVAEWTLRRIDPERAPVRLVQLGQVLAGDPRSQFMELIEPDPQVFWRLAPGVRLERDLRPFFGLVSNGQSLREEREIPPRADKRELRVLCLGDSVTFGYLLRAEESFVQAAEDHLEALLPDTPVECINAGVPGYSLYQGWRFLETRGAEFDPDWIVLNFGWNDGVEWDGLSDFESHRQFERLRPPGPLAHSRLAQKLWALGPSPAMARESRPRLTPEEFGDLLARCEARVQALGARLVLLMGVSRANLTAAAGEPPLSEYQLQQVRFAKTRGIPLVDGVAIARKLHGSLPVEQLLLDPMHPTARLNREWGAALAQHIAERAGPPHTQGR